MIEVSGTIGHSALVVVASVHRPLEARFKASQVVCLVVLDNFGEQ